MGPPSRLPPIHRRLLPAARTAWALLAGSVMLGAGAGVVQAAGASGSGWTGWLHAGAAAVLLGAAAMLFLQRARDAVGALLSAAFLLLAASLPVTQDGWRGLMGWAPPLYAPQALGAGLLLFILFVFPDGRFAPRWSRWTGLPAAMLAAAAVWLSPATNGATLPVFFGLAGAGLAAQYGRFRRGRDIAERQQLKWALFGFAAGVGSLLLRALTYFGPRWLGWDLDGAPARAAALVSEAAGAAGYLLIPMGLFIALQRFRLWAADAVIERSAAVTILTLGAGAVWAGLDKALEVLVQEWWGGEASAASTGLAAAVAALMVAPVAGRVNAWTEKRFQPALHDLRAGMPGLLETLREEEVSSETLLDVVARRVGDGVRVTRVAAAIVEPDGPTLSVVRGVSVEDARAWLGRWRPNGRERALTTMRADRLFPVRLALACERAEGWETVGWLLLGPRPDGSPPGRDERGALLELSGPVARTLSAVRRREARDRSRELRLARLEAAGARRAPV